MNQEPELVQIKRAAVLAARGLVEMLVLRGIQARQLLAHGQYQTSLRHSRSTTGPALVENGSTELAEMVVAIEEALGPLVSAMDACGSMDVAFAASPNGITVIACELDDCTRRIPQVASLASEWRKALTGLARK